MHHELFAIAQKYGDDCKECKEICCANMALTITRDEVKRMAKHLKMTPYDFRVKNTVLFKNWLKEKGAEWKASTPEGQRDIDKNPRLLRFVDIKIDQNLFTEEQIDRMFAPSDERKMDERFVTICTFFNTETHKCKVHQARPMACYDFPFNRTDNGNIDIRKVNACIFATNFLIRVHYFLQKMNLPSSLDKTIQSGDYHNHFYLPEEIVHTYILWECERLHLPIVSPGLKELAVKISKHGDAQK